ncbi:hypothetical protein P5V15_012187 [Pogonomyrmex californicus]
MQSAKRSRYNQSRSSNVFNRLLILPILATIIVESLALVVKSLIVQFLYKRYLRLANNQFKRLDTSDFIFRTNATRSHVDLTIIRAIYDCIRRVILLVRMNDTG